MPSTTQAQAGAAGAAYGATKKGKRLPRNTPAGQMQEGMDLSQLREFASTPRKGLPKKASLKNKKPAKAAAAPPWQK
jgi:hypothetical protein